MTWFMNWDMDGMQWNVLRIDLYELKQVVDGYEGSYHECFKFMFKHLFSDGVPDIFMHCTEGTFKLTEQDVRYVLVNYCPEELL